MDVVERLSLEAARARTLLACTHLHRYRLAQRACAGLTVVDLCCGSGYGSAMLAEASPAVVGVDRDVAVIDTARATLGREGLTFRADDAVRFVESGEADGYGALVCFEGIEHVADQDALVASLVRLADNGMRLVLSVPNSAPFGEQNPFHVRDFDAESAEALAARFPNARMLHQYDADGSVILADETDAQGRVTLRDRVEPEWAAHFLLLVNVPDDVDLTPAAGFLQVEATPLHSRYVRDLEEANRTLQRENARLLRGRLGHHAAAAGARLDRLRTAQRTIRDLESRLSAMVAAAPFLNWRPDDGWHALEIDEDDVAFRWSASGSAIRVGAEHAPRPQLRMMAQVRTFLRERTIAVLVDGQEKGRFAAGPREWSTIDVRIPAGVGEMRIVFHPDPASDSASLINPADQRDLGFALADGLTLVPLW